MSQLISLCLQAGRELFASLDKDSREENIQAKVGVIYSLDYFFINITSNISFYNQTSY